MLPPFPADGSARAVTLGPVFGSVWATEDQMSSTPIVENLSGGLLEQSSQEGVENLSGFCGVCSAPTSHRVIVARDVDHRGRATAVRSSTFSVC